MWRVTCFWWPFIPCCNRQGIRSPPVRGCSQKVLWLNQGIILRMTRLCRLKPVILQIQPLLSPARYYVSPCPWMLHGETVRYLWLRCVISAPLCHWFPSVMYLLSVNDRKLDLRDTAQRLVVSDVVLQANHFLLLFRKKYLRIYLDGFGEIFWDAWAIHREPLVRMISKWQRWSDVVKTSWTTARR